MVAYIIFISNLVIKEPPDSSPITVEANAAIYQAINQSADPCDSFELYACGHYTDFNAIDPWRATHIISNRKIQFIVDECKETVTNWSLPPQTEPISTLLKWGFVVNNVSMDWTWQNKTVRLVVVGDDCANDTATPPPDPMCLQDIIPEHIAHENVIIQGNPCELLSKNFTHIQPPPNYPNNCKYLVGMMQAERISQAMPVSNISDIVDPIRKAYGLNTSFHLGGGPGLVRDIPFTPNLATMWITQHELLMNTVGHNLLEPTWAMSANVVNMWYDSDQDAVFVPSAMLFPPMYHEDYDFDVKLGTIGFFISHEFGHALDFRRKNASLGQMLVDRIALAANQTDLVNVTVHEDIADYYGILFLEKAFGSLTKPTLLKLAQSFCMESEQFTGDVHAPGRWRVNTTVSFSKSYSEWCL